MRYLVREWRRIAGDLKDRHLYLFLDFDGTLTRIRRRPGEVKLGKAVRDALRKLAARKDVSLAIISGRELKEIQKLVGVRGIIYAGNHGLETVGPNYKFTVPEALRSKKVIAEINRKLRKEFRGLRGVLVENKDLTLSVHFRMARRSRLKEIERIFKNITAPYRSGGRIVVTTGKKVWEVRPPVKWNKGKAVLRLLEQKDKRLKRKISAFYIGDDRTDEDAFRLLKRRAYIVKVGEAGRKSTRAGYYLRNTKEVKEFLKKILIFKGEEKYV